jgi:hypothetical protein
VAPRYERDHKVWTLDMDRIHTHPSPLPTTSASGFRHKFIEQAQKQFPLLNFISESPNMDQNNLMIMYLLRLYPEETVTFGVKMFDKN